ESLQVLGRIHSADDILRSVQEAEAAGFTNINLDIMYALPGQTLDDARFDLEQAIGLRPAHISWYQLTLEPNTVFYAQPPPGIPDDDLSYEIQQEGQSLLAACGYEQYEISAYASNGQRCRHNLNYWSFGDYVAIGAGAHGKISRAGGVWRYVKAANPTRYMELMESGRGNVDLTAVGDAERVFEFMLNALRLTEGFEMRLFEERTGLAAELIREKLAALQKNRLVAALDGSVWRVTGRGQRFLNDVQAEFLP
ncbi:MAG: radical SAM family heme chaperone HemW, partial [Gammaproteobacteria bacterium]|nr:radical SAM family heme chaperone HemW [Gammaproteobacteria bacterium]